MGNSASIYNHQILYQKSKLIVNHMLICIFFILNVFLPDKKNEPSAPLSTYLNLIQDQFFYTYQIEPGNKLMNRKVLFARL